MTHTSEQYFTQKTNLHTVQVSIMEDRSIGICDTNSKCTARNTKQKQQ